jgi:hypothetical protein
MGNPVDHDASAAGSGGTGDAAPDGQATDGTPAPRALYTPAPSACLAVMGEAAVTVTIGDATLADAQMQIDAARGANASAAILVKMSGAYVVTSSPLRLPSQTCLVLTGTLQAGPGATAGALLLISGQSKVSVSGGTYDGAGAPLDGIRVDGSRKVNIDGVTVRNAGHAGIAFAGPGGTVWDGGSALTRCDVAHSAAGIHVEAATRVLVLDSNVHDNMGPGIDFAGSAGFGAIVHNRASSNATGINVDGADNAVTDNVLTGNANGLVLGPMSANNSCLDNALADNSSAGIQLAGDNNLVYANSFTGGAMPLVAAGTTNSVVPVAGPLAPGANKYFFPPTIANPHTSPIASGKGRTDLTVKGGSMADVQAQYDAARAAHPDDVIVLHLQGRFTLGTPFTLSSFTSVLLDGTIDVMATSGPVIVGTPGVQYLSISGGTLDAHNTPIPGIFLDLGTLAVLDHVAVNNFGVQNPRSGSASIRMGGGSGYSIIRGCHVDVSGGRAIWTENASSRFIVVGNTSSHANMDGIDFDAHTANSLAKDNVCDGNTRSGIFIEEGAAFNKAYGNVFSNTSSHGINIYSNLAGKSSHQNMAFCNALPGNNNGVRIGAINGNTTSDTFLFNNVISNTKGSGLTIDPLGANNYASLNVMSGNNPDFTVDPMGGADFFSAPSAP